MVRSLMTMALTTAMVAGCVTTGVTSNEQANQSEQAPKVFTPADGEMLFVEAKACDWCSMEVTTSKGVKLSKWRERFHCKEFRPRPAESSADEEADRLHSVHVVSPRYDAHDMSPKVLVWRIDAGGQRYAVSGRYVGYGTLGGDSGVGRIFRVKNWTATRDVHAAVQAPDVHDQSCTSRPCCCK